jgi:hypothetical protein
MPTRTFFQFGKIIFGSPQVFALMLLACLALQSGWLIIHVPFSFSEQDHIWSGREELEYGSMPRKFLYSPLVNIWASAPMKLDERRIIRKDPTPEHVRREVARLRWMLRLPFVIAGLLLGASIWYVARRLYGNQGGYVALALYCFSPAIVLRAATIDEALPAAWGIFGIVFTAIAISHNLYAPMRRWRYRTVLLSIAIALAVSSHPAAVLVVPAAYAFMLYLAPGRRLAATAVMIVAVIAAILLTYSAYAFRPQSMMSGIDLRAWLVYQPRQAQQMLLGDIPTLLSRFNPAVLLLLISAVVTYVAWPRTRYFGNTAPLIAGAALLYLSLTTGMALTASIWALPFIFVFIGGIWADLLETRRRNWALAALLLLLCENAWFCWTMVRHTSAV